MQQKTNSMQLTGLNATNYFPFLRVHQCPQMSLLLLELNHSVNAKCKLALFRYDLVLLSLKESKVGVKHFQNFQKQNTAARPLFSSSKILSDIFMTAKC